MSTPKKVVTRFAPSPTGFMHIGGARTALFAWAFARKNKGTFILRIEDTDKKREVEGSISHIIESLKWLKINWDEGPDIGGPNAPYLQSERLSSYKKYAQILVDKGLAYADPYTPEELERFRKQAEESKKPFLYRNHRPENPPTWDGTKPLRFKNTNICERSWNDLVRGNLKAGVDALDDIILIKSDGYPTYNFAHIIDDLEMGVTHIFRADEFISSVPNYLSLYEALEIERPEFVTLPPIMGPDGNKKLGKRDGAKDLLDYKKEGYLPDAVRNFLAFIGWNPGDNREILSKEEFIDSFSIEGIQTGGGKFNEEKLQWFNREYIKNVPKSLALEKIKEFVPKNINNDTVLEKLVPVIIERINTWNDVDKLWQEEFNLFFSEPSVQKENLICGEKMRKGVNVNFEDIKRHLEYIIEKINLLKDSFNPEDVKNILWDYATQEGRGIVLWTMRYALSGKEKSPDPFVITYVLGKNETINRLSHAKELL